MKQTEKNQNCKKLEYDHLIVTISYHIFIIAEMSVR